MRGAYILVIRVEKPMKIKVGSLGIISFKRGYYCYVGSAMGRGKSLEKRIARHLRKRKKMKWHIDYLLKNKNAEVAMVFLFPSERRIECSISRKLEKLATCTIRGFGSSDCHCKGHLHYFASFEKLKDALIALVNQNKIKHANRTCSL